MVVFGILNRLGKRIPRIISPFVFWSVCIVLSVMIVSVTIPGVFKLPEQGFTISGFLNLFYAYIMAAKPYAHQNWFFWMILSCQYSTNGYCTLILVKSNISWYSG